MLFCTILLVFLMWSKSVVAQGPVVPCTACTSCRLPPFWATTFNTFLLENPELPGVPPTAPLRQTALIEALKQSESDVICLNEVWDAVDVVAIANTLMAESAFQYSFSQFHNTDGTLPGVLPSPSCNVALVQALLMCAAMSPCPPLMPGLTFDQFQMIALCIFTACGTELTALITDGGQACFSCLLYSGNVLERCTTAGTPGLRYVPNFGGTMILSRRPLTDMTYTDFHPLTVELITRGYLKATFDNQIDVVCTHLSTPSSAAPDFYPEPFLNIFFNNYIEQNLFETNALITTFGSIQPLLLLGDLNSGLAVASAGILAKLPAHYQLLKDAFFSTTPTPQCTLCSENIFRPPDSDDVVIDHIFGNGVFVKNTKRIFTPDEYFVEVAPNQFVPLSDHFGSTSRIICDPGKCRRP